MACPPVVPASAHGWTSHQSHPQRLQRTAQAGQGLPYEKKSLMVGAYSTEGDMSDAPLIGSTPITAIPTRAKGYEHRPKGHRQPFPETKHLAITRPGTAFGDGTGRPMALKDTPSATILAVETGSSGIQWPASGDFDIRTMPRTICTRNAKGIASRNTGGFHVIFADGYVGAFRQGPVRDAEQVLHDCGRGEARSEATARAVCPASMSNAPSG